MTATSQKILVVEDDRRIASELEALLVQEGFQVVCAQTLVEARAAKLEAATSGTLELALLDLGLPDGDGLQFCRELRAEVEQVPIIVLTARNAIEDRVRGLRAGADDYLGKPCHPFELIARIRSVLRRAGHSTEEDVARVGDLWIDEQQHTAGRGEQLFRLKPREFELFAFLLRHPGRPWTRDQLLDEIWGRDYSGDTRTVDVHVRRLRAQIEPDPSSPRYLLTEWGLGYRLEEPE